MRPPVGGVCRRGQRPPRAVPAFAVASRTGDESVAARGCSTVHVAASGAARLGSGCAEYPAGSLPRRARRETACDRRTRSPGFRCTNLAPHVTTRAARASIRSGARRTSPGKPRRSRSASALRRVVMAGSGCPSGNGRPSRAIVHGSMLSINEPPRRSLPLSSRTGRLGGTRRPASAPRLQSRHAGAATSCDSRHAVARSFPPSRWILLSHTDTSGRPSLALLSSDGCLVQRSSGGPQSAAPSGHAVSRPVSLTALDASGVTTSSPRTPLLADACSGHLRRSLSRCCPDRLPRR